MRPLLALAITAIAATLSDTAAQQAPPGALRGSVFDADFDVPLGGARVSLVEARLQFESTEDGNFVFEAVPPGSYTLLVAKGGFERAIVSAVVVASERLTDVGRIDLRSEVNEIEELVVTGDDLLGDSELGILDLRAEAIVLQDSISAELIGKAGASDVAGAIKLVTGVSVREGKYATVRGLSDRYTGTTLNGVRIPSADPRRRAVQVDLFPTGTIENVTVTKSFTPDLQGDFTGGGVDIATKAIPDELTLSIAIAGEWDSLASREPDFPTYEGGGTGVLANSKADHALPPEAGVTLPAPPSPVSLPSPEQIAAAEAYDTFTRAFEPVMGIDRAEVGSNASLSMLAGDRFELGQGGTLGVLGALAWNHKYDLVEDGENNGAVKKSPDEPILVDKPRSDTKGTDEVLLGGLATVVWQPRAGHEIAARYVINQSAEDTARFLDRPLGPESSEQNQTLQYVERNVTSTQLHGRHELPGLSHEAGPSSIDWTYAWNATSQDEPDVRYFRNFYEPATLRFSVPNNSTEPEVTRRTFRTIDESNTQAILNLRLPFVPWSDTKGELRFGGYSERTERDFDQDSYFYSWRPPLGGFTNTYTRGLAGYNSYTGDDAGDLWTDVFLEPRRIGHPDVVCVPPQTPFSFGAQCASASQLLWFLQPLGDDVNYDGEQAIDAAYAMADLPLHPEVRLIGGLRWETTEIGLVPFNPVTGTVEIIEIQESGARAEVTVPQEEAIASISRRDLLPALGVVWEPIDGMNVRASWGETIARPTFRELAPVISEEFLAGDEFLGNPDLAISDITNWDLRWEWFRRPGEVLAASLFYKAIENPIEYVAFSTGNRSFVQPVNFEHGELRGFEVEARTDLGALWKPLAKVTVGANYAYLDTEVEIPAFEQESLASFGLEQPTRRLQGQPEYVINANLTYDDDARGTSASLFFNRIGDTLLTGASRGATDGVPDTFETAQSTLDLALRQGFRRLSERAGAEVALVFRVRNLLTPQATSVYRAPDGQEAIKTLRPTPMRISLGFSMTW